MKKILLDVERMKYANNGLFHFCSQLINAIASQPNFQQNEQFSLFAPPAIIEDYKDAFEIFKFRSLYKFFLPFTGKYDIWHSTFQNTRYFPYHFRGKIVYTVHDFNFMYEAKFETKRVQILKDIQKKVDRADVIVAISKFVKSEIEKYCQVDVAKIVVIYNGCNILEKPKFEAPKVKPNLPFFFTIGTILEKKNFKVLPSMLLKNDYDLVIAGEHSDYSYCQKIWERAKYFGVSKRVRLIGAISDNEKNWYLKNCQALPFPSLAEGFGLPVLEAMHFGKPTILSKLTSLPEIGGAQAYYYDNFEPDHIAERTMEVMADYNTDVLGKSDAIKAHAGQFTWEGAAKKYNEIYKRLLD
ncbi:glycosyltransferase family 4 protein [Rhizosphaericola mali]|uniref:Glycosyltransferase family 4 protein n=1 Tax=Rhizosphaericola mali TaxID=2545455 RepID=A0A5P2G890_9BACT|nr:glycosyltransferase family 1 protein [Rhizosphaericola mali]QES90519.1 glycosyltransferase family 4 protein [Rhizosphaericola mali]